MVRGARGADAGDALPFRRRERIAGREAPEVRLVAAVRDDGKLVPTRGEARCDVPELAGEVLVDQKDLHACACAAGEDGAALAPGVPNAAAIRVRV